MRGHTMNDRIRKPSTGPHAERARLPAYLAGGLKESERLPIETHLVNCAGCRQEAEALQHLWDSLPDRAPASSPRDLWPGVRARIAASRIVPLPSRQYAWRMAASFAAGILVAIAIWVSGTGGVSDSQAADLELMVHESMFQQLDPVPPESFAGRYLLMVEAAQNEGGPP